MTDDIPQTDKIAMAMTLRLEAASLADTSNSLIKIADTLDPPQLPQHSTASHMS